MAYTRVPCTVVGMTEKAVRIQTKGTPEDGPQYVWIPLSQCKHNGYDVTDSTKVLWVKKWLADQRAIP